jgi:hypothetical protein
MPRIGLDESEAFGEGDQPATGSIPFVGDEGIFPGTNGSVPQLLSCSCLLRLRLGEQLF